MNTVLKTASALLLAVGLFASGAASATPNLLINGSFETGDLTGWSLTGNTAFTSVVRNYPGYRAEDGNYALVFGPTGSNGVLSQTFTDVAGGLLTVTGYLAGNGTSPSNFSASIDGHVGFAVNPVPAEGYTLFSFTFLATGLDTLSLNFRNDPDWDAVDNLVVTEALPIPEPAGLTVLGAGLFGLGLIKRRWA